MEVNSRLWLGGGVSRHRDRELIRRLLIGVRGCGPVERILLVTDGLASYARQALHVFREPLHNGKVGRPRLVLATTVMVARIKKRYERGRVVEVIREVVRGAEAAVRSRIEQTQCSAEALINTAYIELLNATFRSRLAPLVRRTRAGAHKQSTVEWGMWLVGSCYNFVWAHCSLPGGAHSGDGSGDRRSSLVYGRGVVVSGADCGATQVAGEEATVAAGGRACNLTTVQCGATTFLSLQVFQAEREPTSGLEPLTCSSYE